MAMRTFQLCLVFAVGYFFQRTSALLGNTRALSLDSSTPLSSSSLNNAAFNYNVSLRFVEEPSDVVVARGQDVILRCRCESTRGSFTITWMYDGQPLNKSDSRWTVEGVMLHLHHVSGGKKMTSTGNAGEYACLARNQAGAVVSRTARVKVAVVDKEVAVLVDNQTIYESQPMLLHCSVHSTPSAEIQWEFNHLPLPKDKRYVPLPNGSLLVRNTKLSDTGSYKCIAENTILKKIKYSKVIEIKIIPLNIDSIPPSVMLVKSSLNRTAIVGDTVDFYCIVAGYPTPTVQWRNSRKAALSNSSLLVLSNVQPKDTGNYTCLAKSSRGEASQQFHLDVYQKPFFNLTPMSNTLPLAKTVRLDCQAKGIPQPRVFWLKDGVPLNFGGRIKKQLTGLVLSHSFSSDSGIYQCIAVNAVGKISTAAQIEINSQGPTPPPPQNVKCRPYDSKQICITWKDPPNITPQAYTVYSFFINDGVEVPGPEYVSTETNMLASDLKNSTNYSFYVRLYSKQASDQSERVACQTGVKDYRNLDIDVVNTTSLMLKWNKLNSDTHCNGTKDPYIVQWYREGEETQIMSERVTERKLLVTDLLPATDYQFRVVNSLQDEPWTLYSIPEVHETDAESSDPTSELRAPRNLHEMATTSTTTRMSWERVSNAKFYTVCYVPAKENRECEEDDFIKNYSPKFSISKLTPNTDYLFKVRAHDSKNVPGVISQPLLIHTLADVPSSVEHLEYKPLNSTTACIHWRPPKNHYGHLKRYMISYTTDPNFSLEHLIEYNVTTDKGKEHFCWKDHDEQGEIWSTLLTNLSTKHIYLFMVRAVNEFGVGQPLTVKLDISNKSSEPVTDSEQGLYNQKVGVLVGTTMAVICVLCCMLSIILRRRFIKRMAMVREADRNYYPAMAHYTSQIGTVEVRTEQPCAANEHEIEHLVHQEQSSHIPPITPDHLDTKGANDFPNGHVNGTNKPTQTNGIVLNGHVHITENPQYYAFECNGNITKNKSEPLLRHYGDFNPSTKIRPPFYKFFETSRKPKESAPNGGTHPTNGESSLHARMRFLDHFLASERRRLSPVLEPNG